LKKIFIFPLWIRIWHWTNALLFLILMFTGISLHFSSTGSLLLPYKASAVLHNVSGVLLVLLYLFYFIWNFKTKNIKHYIVDFKGVFKKITIHLQYYFLGIFANKPNPHSPTQKSKFHPIQQLFYFITMYVLVPIVAITGIFLLFPTFAPDAVLGKGGILPMAILHSIATFFLIIFFLLHFYLATTGKTIFELLKSMFTGWILGETDDEELQAQTYSTSILLDSEKKFFPIIFYNPITIAGSLIAVISFAFILFFVGIAFFSEHLSPYIGIVTFIILPSAMVFGLLLIILGAFKENRARLALGEKYTKKLPVIDLNIKKNQITALIFILGTIVLAGFSVFGSFKAYEYTESDEFCGTLCHQIMEPEYTAYQNSPHSQVNCVTCHIGSGADWFVKAKISGSYQVYAALMGVYPRPIPTPVENLRPAAETCEKCHRPEHFFAEKKYEHNFYASDEKNSHSKIELLVKVGGGSPETGNNFGIHWNMNLKNEITYFALDRQRADIPWVKSKDRKTGVETVYSVPGFKMTDELKKDKDKMRRMDCIDCHNRPSHIYKNPNIEVNAFIAAGKIDRSLPYIKMLAVQTLENYVSSRETSFNDIKSYLYKYYQSKYPQILAEKKDQLDNSIKSINEIYLRNYFPEMGVTWKKFPINIGHMYSAGCYRCHDGKHVSPEGKVISQDCNICHSIIQQETPFTNGKISGENLTFMHPGSADKTVKIKNCPVCHGVQNLRIPK
jgi:thiosulfate reductase cytochrome b subunit/nitrate/TMAO reductase-like tetraheme cytochrome c subunit